MVPTPRPTLIIYIYIYIYLDSLEGKATSFAGCRGSSPEGSVCARHWNARPRAPCNGPVGRGMGRRAARTLERMRRLGGLIPDHHLAARTFSARLTAQRRADGGRPPRRHDGLRNMRETCAVAPRVPHLSCLADDQDFAPCQFAPARMCEPPIARCRPSPRCVGGGAPPPPASTSPGVALPRYQPADV